MIDVLIGTVLFAAVCAGLDRLRGAGIVPSAAAKLAYGLWIGGFLWSVLGIQEWYFAALFGALWALGSTPGWGHPVGKALGGTNVVEPEWWQKGQLATNVPLALGARGVMWAAPCLPLMFFDPRVAMVLTMGPAFLAAPYIANKTTDVITDRWGPMELIRGALFGGLTCVGVLLSS